jgi:hypothetical protein
LPARHPRIARNPKGNAEDQPSLAHPLPAALADRRAIANHCAAEVASLPEKKK